MKKFLAWLLLAATILSLWGCAAASAQPEKTAESTETTTVTEMPAGEEQATAPAAALPASEERLFLKAASVTFSLVGESDDIYLGMAPRELVSWESDDPDVVSVENGVLTATGVGTTVVRATYGSQTVECAAGCLAETQEELDALAPAVLSAPKRLPMEVNMEEPCTYFDDDAIIGDSITYFLWQAESQNNHLGDMVFITRQGISIQGLVLRFKNLYFEGHEMFVEDIAAKCEAERIYIMLGCLDFQVPEACEALIDNWTIMLDRILQKCPDKEIVIISNIPGFTEGTTPTEYNAAVAEVTAELRQLAADKGCGFLDLGYYIQDHYGRMPAIYCKDEYHMNADGSRVWMQVMRYYAQYEQNGGTLS